MADQAQEFAGKVAVITGAGAGFGAGFAHALAMRGAAVAVLDIDMDAARRTAASIREQGGKALEMHCDVGDDASVPRVMEKIAAEFGGIDILINNAGLHSAAFSKGFDELGLAETRRLFDVNMFGVINCALACRPFMAARGGGAVVNIASIAGFSPTTTYGVSKLAVRGVTIALSGEFAKDSIRVNAIAPGLIATDKIRADFPDEFFERFIQMQHVKRTGEVNDIVAAMLYLCSDRASFVTGETLKVAGGASLSI